MPRRMRKKCPQEGAWEAEVQRVWADCGARLAGGGERAFHPGVLTAAVLPRLVGLLLVFWRPALRGAPHRGALHVGGHRVTRGEISRLFRALGFAERSGQSWQRLLAIFGAAFAATAPTPQRAARITAFLREVLLGEGDKATATIGGMWRRTRGLPDEPGPWWGRCLRRPELSPAALTEKWLAEIRKDLWCIGWPEPTASPPQRQQPIAALSTVAAADLEQFLGAFTVGVARLEAEAPERELLTTADARTARAQRPPPWRAPARAGPPPGG